VTTKERYIDSSYPIPTMFSRWRLISKSSTLGKDSNRFQDQALSRYRIDNDGVKICSIAG
jgi:hypothetical protein